MIGAKIAGGSRGFAARLAEKAGRLAHAHAVARLRELHALKTGMLIGASNDSIHVLGSRVPSHVGAWTRRTCPRVTGMSVVPNRCSWWST